MRHTCGGVRMRVWDQGAAKHLRYIVWCSVCGKWYETSHRQLSPYDETRPHRERTIPCPSINVLPRD